MAGVVAGVMKGVLPVVVAEAVAGDCIVDWYDEDGVGAICDSSSCSEHV